MLQLWRGAKLFAQRLGWMEKGLRQVGLCALAVLVGTTTPRKKKAQTSILAGGVFVAACLPLMNKFLDIAEEMAEENQK